MSPKESASCWNMPLHPPLVVSFLCFPSCHFRWYLPRNRWSAKDGQGTARAAAEDWEGRRWMRYRLRMGFLFSTKGHNPLRYPSAGTKMLQLSALRLPVVQLSQSFTAFHRFTHRIFPIASIQWVCLQSQHKKNNEYNLPGDATNLVTTGNTYWLCQMSSPNPSQQIWIQHPTLDHYV